MDDYIQISKLNDFLFCPFSLYFHSVYEDFSQSVCHTSSQTRGKLIHQCFDNGVYSTAKKYLQGIDIFSEKYGLIGKIDLFDKENGILVERKNKIKKIYDGYLMQLYAQYFCLVEMGYAVNEIALYSFADNKKYSISLPCKKAEEEFTDLVDKIRSFNLLDFKRPSKLKCEQCIYRQICFI